MSWASIVNNYQPHERSPILLANVEAYVLQLARARAAAASILADGLTIDGPDGKSYPNPALEIEREAQKQIREWAKTLT